MTRTPKGKGSIRLPCLHCGKPHRVFNSIFVRSKLRGAFCSVACWKAALKRFFETYAERYRNEFQKVA